ncbi:MAG: OmpP1/FadL family transporter [Desulfobacca sp.]|uniref:OmpP1/FadL family transporter n=1 Tax=Desulfobacca sp. TaxID=2067990 RepID=UPI004049DF06
MSRKLGVLALVLGFFVFLAGSVGAAGFAILQQGTAAMAQGNAFVAQADDPSAIFYNPAGLTQLRRPQIYVHTVFSATDRRYISPLGSYTTGKHQIFAIPATYGVLPVNDRLVFGVGLFSPFGLGTTWPPSWAGRFLTTSSRLHTFNFNPVVAFKVMDNFSIGVGFNVLWSKVNIQRRTLLGPFSELKSDFEGDGVGLGYNFGLLYEPVPGVKLGLAYRSEIRVKHEGDLKVAWLAPVGANAAVVYPPSLTWGVAVSSWQPWVVEFDVTWTGWSTYDYLRLDLTQPLPGPTTTILQEKRWRDAWAFRLGGNYQIRPGMKIRAGYIYDLTPVPSGTFDPTIPDANRHIFTFGGDMEIKSFTLGFAYNYIASENRSKANTLTINGVPLPPGLQANGKYKSDNHSLGFSLAYKF